MLELQENIQINKSVSLNNGENILSKVNKTNISLLNELKDLIDKKGKLKKIFEENFIILEESQYILPLLFMPLAFGLISSFMIYFKIELNLFLYVSIILMIVLPTYPLHQLIKNIKNKNKKYIEAKSQLYSVEMEIKLKIEELNNNGFFKLNNKGNINEEKIINKRIEELKDEIIFCGIMKTDSFKKNEKKKDIVFDFNQLINMLLSYKLFNENELKQNYEL